MEKFDQRIDAYIAKSAPFAKEILEHLRQLVHDACPDVEETIKWGFPHFEYKGILCSMAAFKGHCAFGFWKGAIMKDPKNVMTIVGKTSMGSFNRITSINDLPSNKILISYIKEAKTLNEDDIKLPERVKKKTSSVKIPSYFLDVLKKNKKAFATFQGLSNSNKKDYTDWITEAKTESTREKRIQTSLGWLAEGKTRNWKYSKKL
jgi:uncharacterized protein YdeI (YjbR/CyaY-like superfamily)